MRIINALLIIFLGLSFTGCTKDKFDVERPNVLVLLLDTLRADHLSGYGYERETSPNLDAFAAENLKFEYALTAAPWTPASVATILTGLYPAAHGMMPPNDREIAKAVSMRLNPNLETMPEILKKYGYKTAAVSPNPWISESFGYTQGFDQFFYIHRQVASEIVESGEEIITKWLDESKKPDQKLDPFFLYLHFLDPHDPYDPPVPYKEKFKGPLTKSPFNYDDKMLEHIERYDGEINYLDNELGKLFTFLKEKNLYEDLFIIIVADHGEQFMEHGDQRHGYKLFNEETHVPLLIRTGRARDAGRVVNETVSTVDILPTLLKRVNVSIPSTLPGVQLFDEDALKIRSGVMSEIRRIYDMKAVTDNQGQRLVMQTSYSPSKHDLKKSLEAWHSPEIVGLFDTHSDYACLSKVTNPALETRLKGKFDEIYTNALNNTVAPVSSGSQLKDETLDQLKSLGYLN